MGLRRRARGILPWALVLISLGCASVRKEVGGPGPAPASGRLHSDEGQGGGNPLPVLAETPRGPFGLSLVSSEDGKPADLSLSVGSEECGACHTRQWDELEGSMHSAAHTDPLYRRTAEVALAEAGPEVYALCAGCHAPLGVIAGLIPRVPESELPPLVKAGIGCDVCHQVSALTGAQGPWKEPGNASMVLSPDADRKFGPSTGDDSAAPHATVSRELFSSSEFCASCHTIIHPFNGLRIENTYNEWKGSVYAANGIQCQGCHMRSVEDARTVARTLKPVPLIGKSEPSGEDRPTALHTFVGGNSNAARLSGSPRHAALAEERLKSAAELEIEAPALAAAGRPLLFSVSVKNVGAGHNLPTSITELREMWVELAVTSASGDVLWRSGWLDEQGDIEKDAMRFGAWAGDAQGRHTHKPWEITHFIWQRLVPPKGVERDRFRVSLPRGLAGAVRITARLLYRSASPAVIAQFLKEEAFPPATVEMARAEAMVGSSSLERRQGGPAAAACLRHRSGRLPANRRRPSRACGRGSNFPLVGPSIAHRADL